MKHLVVVSMALVCLCLSGCISNTTIVLNVLPWRTSIDVLVVHDNTNVTANSTANNTVAGGGTGTATIPASLMSATYEAPADSGKMMRFRLEKIQ